MKHKDEPRSCICTCLWHGVRNGRHGPASLEHLHLNKHPHVHPQQLSFSEFKATFNRTYANETEEAYRAAVYNKLASEIEVHNAKGLSYTLGINQFSDMTHEEFKGRF